jgi:hypothetical protein
VLKMLLMMPMLTTLLCNAAVHRTVCCCAAARCSIGRGTGGAAWRCCCGAPLRHGSARCVLRAGTKLRGGGGGGGHGPRGGLKLRPSTKKSKMKGAGNRPKMRRSKNTPKMPTPTDPSYNFPSTGAPVGKTFLLFPPADLSRR